LAKHPGSTVQSVERAIAVLRLFSLKTPERGVTEVGRELGLHKSTVSRLMFTTGHFFRGAKISYKEIFKIGNCSATEIGVWQAQTGQVQRCINSFRFAPACTAG